MGKQMGTKLEEPNSWKFVLVLSVFGALFACISTMAMGWNMQFYILGLATVCGFIFLIVSFFPSNPNLFLGSGRTPATTFSQELVLKRVGGFGDSYFCHPSVAFGALKDFRYTKGKKVDFARLLEEKGDVIGPYCVDDETRSVVFVETRPEFDPAEVGPFYFQSQRDNAIRLYTVPYEEYHRVVAKLSNKLSNTKNLLLVYNVSRCGSTLLSKCLDSLVNVRSISEPDVLTSLTHMASEAKGSRDEDIIALAQSSAKLLCYLRRRRYPECETVCIKFRFQMVYIADLVNKALPDAKAIFLYRNALDVIDSMGAAFINTGLYRAVRRVGLDTFYVFYASSLPQHLWKLMPLMNDTVRFPVSSYMWLGAVCPFVLSWMSVMHYGMDAYERGFVTAMIRYEDMVVGKTQLVGKMLKEIGLLDRSVVIASQADVFNKDAHANSTTHSRRTVFDKDGQTSRKGYAYLRGDDAGQISAVLARHEVIETSDFIIPGTLTV